MFVHSSSPLKRWGFLYIFGFHIGELRFNPRYFHSGGFFIDHIKFIYQSKKVVKLLFFTFIRTIKCHKTHYLTHICLI